MSTLRTAFTLTSVAFMIGVGVVLASIQYRHFGASFDTKPAMASDDVGHASDAEPSATSSIH
jgi:hypothetical protein